MKLAFIYLGWRGAGLPISYELATHLKQQAQVLAVLSKDVNALPEWQTSGIERLAVPTYHNLPQAVWSWVHQAQIAKLALQLQRWQPDVLLFPMFYTWNPFIQRRLRGIPAVVAVHDPRGHPDLNGFLWQLMENYSIRHASRCLVFSQLLQPELEKRGVDPEQIDYIPLGPFPYPQPAHKPATSVPTLLFFGRITSYKGLEVLLKAFQRVRQNIPSRLLIVGVGDLRPYASLLRQAPDVELVNRWIDENEIPGFFSRATLLVLPYTSASQSGVLPVAANFGIPVIASRVGGIPEQIEDGRTGLLTEPGSVEELIQAIERLLKDEKLAQSLGENLRHEFEQHRNWALIAQKVYVSCQKAMPPA